MTTEPSWLCSTIAKSLAVIVAIICGLFSASVLMLITEKQILNNQLANKKTQLAHPRLEAYT